MLEYVSATGSWNEVEQRAIHDRRFSANHYRILVHKGTDVGVVAFEITESAFRLNQIFILPEFQSIGIGARCMTALEKEASEQSLPLILQVRKLNTRAMEFYERLGYKSFDETEHHIQFIKPLDTQELKR